VLGGRVFHAAVRVVRTVRDTERHSVSLPLAGGLAGTHVVQRYVDPFTLPFSLTRPSIVAQSGLNGGPFSPALYQPSGHRN